MRQKEYRAWASVQPKRRGGGKLSASTVETRITDAKRVEVEYGNLDEAFDRDRLSSTLSALAYNALDKKRGKPNPTLLDIDGDLKKGLEASRLAIRHYLEFRASPPGAVFSSKRNPAWTRDELILALDVYVLFAGNPPAKGSADIKDLSRAVNAVCVYLGGSGDVTLRNPNGVYMKLMNFRHFDPKFVEAGKRGLANGSQLDEEVWAAFHAQPDLLAITAASIRSTACGDDIIEAAAIRATLDAYEGAEAVEGAILTATHLRRERSRALVDKKKRAALAIHGMLCCEVCAFDFAKRYGERGAGFIECHHVRPVATLDGKSATRLDDLALVCSNCHRMIHARSPFLSIDTLRQLLA